MSNQQTALNFLENFCLGKIEKLENLLHDDFTFSGPFIEFDSKVGYIASLKEDPPKDFSIELIGSFEEKDSVGLFYNFSKPGVSTPMAQYFQFNDGKICESLLIFDTRVFNQ